MTASVHNEYERLAERVDRLERVLLNVASLMPVAPPFEVPRESLAGLTDRQRLAGIGAALAELAQ